MVLGGTVDGRNSAPPKKPIPVSCELLHLGWVQRPWRAAQHACEMSQGFDRYSARLHSLEGIKVYSMTGLDSWSIPVEAVEQRG